jgi:uncharacterized protein (TIGR03067 family)
MRKNALLILAGLCLAARAHAVPAPLPRPGKNDPKNIQGTWSLTRLESGGRTLPAEMVARYRAEVTADSWSFTLSGRKAPAFTYTLDPKSKPKGIRLTRPGPRPGLGDVTLYGIYDLQGDTLKLCYSLDRGNEKARPADFTPGPRRVLIFLKRDKKP